MKFKSVTVICGGKKITDSNCIEFTKEEYDEIKKLMPEDDNIKDIDYRELLNKYVRFIVDVELFGGSDIEFELYEENILNYIADEYVQTLNEPLQDNQDKENDK